MNADRLKETVDFLIQKENEHQIGQRLTALMQAVDQLVNQPQQADFQKQTANALDELERVTNALFDSLTPAQIENLKAIHGYEFFSPAMTAEMRRLMAQSGITPAVLQQRIRELISQRDAYLEVLRTTSDRLSKLGIAPPPLNPGDAVIGARLPEILFDKDFGELTKKLATFNRILRLFSQAATGNISKIEVRQISSTDPVFFLGIDATTAVEIAVTITWILNTLKQVFDIRRVRNDAGKVGLSEPELKVFDERIQTTIKKSIDERVEQITSTFRHEAQVPNLEQGLKWACETLVAWIDRGFTIEIRSLRPPTTGDEKTDAANNDRYAQLETLTKQLSFPPVAGPPVLQLPREEPPTSETPAAGSSDKDGGASGAKQRRTRE
jgi:hypothetical protein